MECARCFPSRSPGTSWIDGVRRNHKGKQCDGGGDSVRVSSFLCLETFSVMEWEGDEMNTSQIDLDLGECKGC